MGQKIQPHLFRLGITSSWKSKWFDTKDYAKYLLEDYRIRNLVAAKFKRGVSDVEIERFGNELTVNMFTSRPGMIIGRGGSGVEEFKKALKKKVAAVNVNVNIREIKQPDTDAGSIANNIVEQIERRIPFRRAMKQAMEAAKQARVQGIRISIAGRLNGAEIARRETLSFGKVPLHTLKVPIDYAEKTAQTTYGTIGVKVWTLTSPVAAEESESNNNSFDRN
jgi:small subunit ribosomal protein S3